MNIKFKKLTETAITPFKAFSTDGGFDLFADEDVIVKNNGLATKIKTGIAVNLPDGMYGDIRGRSGLTSKTSLRVQLGTLDVGYVGEIGIIADSIGEDYVVKKGDKIAQLVVNVLPNVVFEEVNHFEETKRGANGFGSTGN